MQRINTFLRTCGMVSFFGLAALALPLPAHAGDLRVSIGFGVPMPVVVAPQPVIVHRAPVVVVQPQVVYAQPQVVYAQPQIPSPTTRAIGSPGDTTIMTMTTAIMRIRTLQRHF